LDRLLLTPADRLQQGLEMGLDAVRGNGRAPGCIAGKAHPLRRDGQVTPFLVGLAMGPHDHLPVGVPIITHLDRVADRADGEDRHFCGAILLDECQIRPPPGYPGRNADGMVGLAARCRIGLIRGPVASSGGDRLV
jgi:hypothetical protein